MYEYAFKSNKHIVVMKGEESMTTIHEIRALSFGFGALFSPKVSVKWKDGKLYYSYNQFGSSIKRYEERVYEKSIEVNHQDILSFLIACGTADIREWNKNIYNNEDILDGMNWGVNIDIVLDEDGEKTLYKVDVNGYEVYPATYNEFVRAVEKLIHESMYSWTYNAAVLDVFMKDETKGEEKRRILFKKITPMVLEIIEKYINIDILDYDVREILMKYMQQAQYFAQEQEDIDIFNCFIRTYYGEKNNDILPLTDYFEDVMIRSFVLMGFDIFEKKA